MDYYGSPVSSSSHVEELDLESEWDGPDPLTNAEFMAMIDMEGGDSFKSDNLALSQSMEYKDMSGPFNTGFDAFGMQSSATPQLLGSQPQPSSYASPMLSGPPMNFMLPPQPAYNQSMMQNNNKRGRDEAAFSQPQSPYGVTTPQSPYAPQTPAFNETTYKPPGMPNQASPHNTNGQMPAQQTVTTKNAEVINELNRVAEQVKKASEKLRHDQKMVPLPLTRETYAVLEKEQVGIKNGIDWIEETHNTLLDGMLLESLEMHQLLSLEQDLLYFRKQLNLYVLELQNFQKEGSIPVYGLHIIAQPFPDSVKQHKSIDEPLNVRMLSGAKFDTRPACTIRAEIIDSSNQKGPAQKKGPGAALVENGEKLINESGIATFNDLKFPTGTRLKSIKIRFSARFNVSDLRGNIHTVAIESEPTNAIVVKTNENQWHEAEGILLKKTAFGNHNEITWFRFSNWLQRRYLGATKQNAQFPVRPLSTYDYQYIHALKFDNKQIITQKHFDNFWSWFGPLIHKIRYQRHVLTLWTRGYICGFLTREEVESVLKNEQIGTFLIRVSERSDQFAVSYQSAESVKHYLLKNDDTHGAKRTLPDFLRDYKDFQCILQLSIDKTTNKRILRRCDKESVLKEFYSKKSSSASPGYEEVIHVQ